MCAQKEPRVLCFLEVWAIQDNTRNALDNCAHVLHRSSTFYQYYYEKNNIHLPSSTLRLFLIQIQEYDSIRSWQPHIWTHAPIQAQCPTRHGTSILGTFCTCKCSATICVPITDNIRSACQCVDEFGCCLPSIRAEE